MSALPGAGGRPGLPWLLPLQIISKVAVEGVSEILESSVHEVLRTNPLRDADLVTVEECRHEVEVLHELGERYVAAALGHGLLAYRTVVERQFSLARIGERRGVLRDEP